MEKLNEKIILIQGAMNIEIEYLISQLENVEEQNISGYLFYIGMLNNTKIVVSKTLIGTINSTIATTIGIINYQPHFVINQGIAGAHSVNIHIGDIIIGEKCCNINSYSMLAISEGKGSSVFEWEPDKRAKQAKYTNAQLLSALQNNIIANTSKQVYTGVLGSGDAFNREVDRIKWLNKLFNTSCEDMESIGTYSVCDKFNVPCIGIRIISNNEILLEELDESQAIELQKILINTLKNIL